MITVTLKYQLEDKTIVSYMNKHEHSNSKKYQLVEFYNIEKKFYVKRLRHVLVKRLRHFYVS